MDVIEIKKSFARAAIQATARKEIQNLSAPLSCYGGIFWGKPTEHWPSLNGRFLLPALSIRTDELPSIPEHLKDIALVNVFIDADEHPDTDGAVVIRQYSSLDGLFPLVKPSNFFGHLFSKPKHPELEFYKILWKETIDYPDSVTMEYLIGEEKYEIFWQEAEKLGDELFENYSNVYGIKIGGWPTMIQMSGVAFIMEGDPEYLMQVDSTEVYSFLDSGIGYLLKSQKGFYMDGWTTA